MYMQGTLVALGALSEGRLADKLKSAALLTPVAYLAHMTTPIGILLAKAFVGEVCYAAETIDCVTNTCSELVIIIHRCEFCCMLTQPEHLCSRRSGVQPDIVSHYRTFSSDTDPFSCCFGVVARWMAG